MRREDAADILGVPVDATASEARTAFRALIRRHHPDRAPTGGGARAHDDTTRLIEAHRAFRTPDGPEPTTVGPTADVTGDATGSGRRGPPVDARVEGDTLLVASDPATTMARLVEAGYALGHVSYLDRSSGLIEVVVLVQEEGDDRPAACSVVASLQGRHHEVEVFCSVERLDGRPAPPIAPIVEALAAEMGL